MAQPRELFGRLLWFAIVATSVLIVSCTESQNESDPDQLNQKAKSLYEEGKYSEASTIFRVLLSETKSAIGSGPELAMAHLNLARILFMSGDFAESDSNYFMAERLFSTYQRGDDTIIAVVFCEHGTVRFAMRDFDAAEDLFARSIGLFETQYSRCDERIQYVRRMQADLNVTRGYIRQGISHMEDWLSCTAPANVARDSLALAYVGDLAEWYNRDSDFDAAIRLTTAYLEFADSAAMTYPEQFAWLYQNQAAANLLLGNIEESIEQLSRGFALIDEDMDTLSRVYREYMGTFGAVHLEQGDTALAVSYFDRYRSLFAIQYGTEHPRYKGMTAQVESLRQVN